MDRKFVYLVLFFLIIQFVIQSCNESDPNELFHSERKISSNHFVGSEVCNDCHEKEYDLWMGSHHQLSMQKADSISVLGDFNDIRFESKGVKYYFFRKDNGYFVNTEGEEGIYSDFNIKYVFGLTPLQQYIIEFENGKHQCLLAAWDSDSSRWFDLQPNLTIHHTEWMHWTGGSMNWNNMCADCHSTYLKKNYRSFDESYETSYTEINVGCEACHGPSDLHVKYYEKEEFYQDLKISPPGLYMPMGMKSTELVQKCARCHARRSMLTEVFDYEGHFLDHYYPNLMRYPTYEMDGQILDEDYVYGSFKQSKMYHNNISCRDCHDMHSMKLKKEGNDLCLGCHEAKYNSPDHHFHKMDDEGALCTNCHMRGRYYMGNDFRHDHSFRNPRPDQSILYGTPNACTACHSDKSDQWASDFIVEKYGSIRPLHYSDWLLPGMAGNMDSLIELATDDRFPEIIRATALNGLTESGIQINGGPIYTLLADSNAMIRKETILALSYGDEHEVVIEARLDDPIRSVRIVAARYFLMRGKSSDHPSFEKSKEEFIKDMEVNSDFASGQHQWALYYVANGDLENARKSYLRALEIDNFFNMSRMNLALMEYTNGEVDKAEKLYLKVIEQEPEYSYPYFMLGLLYHEQEKDSQSLNFLGLSCEREPYIPRAYYNYALKLQSNGKYEMADEILEKALKYNPYDEGQLYVKFLGLIKMMEYDRARLLLDLLLEMDPGNETYIRMKSEFNGVPRTNLSTQK